MQTYLKLAAALLLAAVFALAAWNAATAGYWFAVPFLMLAEVVAFYCATQRTCRLARVLWRRS